MDVMKQTDRHGGQTLMPLHGRDQGFAEMHIFHSDCVKVSLLLCTKSFKALPEQLSRAFWTLLTATISDICCSGLKRGQLCWSFDKSSAVNKMIWRK